MRSRNEDALLVAGEAGLLVVCDGLGGHPAGDVASATAVESLRASAAGAAASADGLLAALHAAHDAVVAAAAGDPDRTGMATTVVAATVGGASARVAHVGDSRAYLLDASDGRLHQVTRDHGMGGYITQALGLDRGVEPDLTEVATPEGTRLLLCSDGLSNMVDAASIGALLAEGSAETACDALVEAALDRGGVDNVTVVVAVF